MISSSWQVPGASMLAGSDDLCKGCPSEPEEGLQNPISHTD